MPDCYKHQGLCRKAEAFSFAFPLSPALSFSALRTKTYSNRRMYHYDYGFEIERKKARQHNADGPDFTL
jgi:hypothetical protein